MSKVEPKTYLIRAGITRNYGEHSIYYEISEQVDVSDGKQRREAFQNLQAQLEDQINVYEAVSLPHVKLPQRGAAGVSSGNGTDTFPLESIVVESKQGKRLVSALGGKWAKFGVPIYRGCQSDLDFEKMDYGNFDYSKLNLTVTVDIEDGKAKRVRSIK